MRSIHIIGQTGLLLAIALASSAPPSYADLENPLLAQSAGFQKFVNQNSQAAQTGAPTKIRYGYATTTPGQQQPAPAAQYQPVQQAPPQPVKPQTRPKQGSASASGIVVSTTNNIEGYKIVGYKGLVQGVSVRQPTWQENAIAGLEGIGGGDMDSYRQMTEEESVEAVETLMVRAKALGANAVVGVHFSTTSYMVDKDHIASQVVFCGTAVVIEKGR